MTSAAADPAACIAAGSSVDVAVRAAVVVRAAVDVEKGDLSSTSNPYEGNDIGAGVAGAVDCTKTRAFVPSLSGIALQPVVIVVPSQQIVSRSPNTPSRRSFRSTPPGVEPPLGRSGDSIGEGCPTTSTTVGKTAKAHTSL